MCFVELSEVTHAEQVQPCLCSSPAPKWVTDSSVTPSFSQVRGGALFCAQEVRSIYYSHSPRLSI